MIKLARSFFVHAKYPEQFSALCIDLLTALNKVLIHVFPIYYISDYIRNLQFLGILISLEFNGQHTPFYLVAQMQNRSAPSFFLTLCLITSVVNLSQSPLD